MDTMLRRIIGENIKFNTVLGQTPDTVFADSGQIEQVLMNLVINSRDAIHGGGSITIRTGSVFLSEAKSKIEGDIIPGAYVFISVGDTGTGMDEATRSRIFEPFFTTKELGKGTGLGLSTVYGIVKQSGGHLEVESQVGYGTTVTIYLPRTEAELYTEPVETKVVPVAESGHGQTILVVEDQYGVRELVRQTLELAGYRVLAAENGAHAIAISKSRPGEIDLVISDVVMPGLSGPDTVEQLLKMNPALRVVYMSGYVNENILGSSATFLQKPFRIDALRGAIAKALAPQEPVVATVPHDDDSHLHLTPSMT
jgi:CheY-like chemotaxis protein